MWDANQLPGYQACADAFQAKFPGTTITVESLGWDDYWNGITTGLVSGTAPDVFTDHLNKYPDYALKDQLIDLNPYIARDGVATDIYYPGLADLWVTPDGKRYGLPKDFDTVAFFYNGQMIEDAGVDPASLSSLTWNPDDGGTFEQLAAKLTIDANGVRGDLADLDSDQGRGLRHGQQRRRRGRPDRIQLLRAPRTASTTRTSQSGAHYNHDDPKYIAFFKWYRGDREGFHAGWEERTGVNYGYYPARASTPRNRTGPGTSVQ
jgi:multiple sugar transport system substrate-binding protein